MSQQQQLEHWITAARGGDRLALTKLLAVHHALMRTRATRQLVGELQGRFDPDDVLQEAYLDVIRQISTFRGDGVGPFVSWLGRIVDHKIIDIRRGAHAHKRDIKREQPVAVAESQSYLDLLDVVQQESDTPSRVIRGQEAIGAIAACVSELSDAHREVIELRFLQGLPLAKVAARMNRSEAAVAALCQRALRELRIHMDRRGEFTRGG